ncbi:hypothetical protein KTI62_15795, partial [Acinetobacter schindleri]|uniref:hypothetical protein n=1 Tax=Acinetobacter schindleri TaxID=108981 RepID=UPI0021CD43AA
LHPIILTVFFLIVTIVQVFKTTFRVFHVVYSSRLYPRAEPRDFTLQWIKIIPVLFLLNS